MEKKKATNLDVKQYGMMFALLAIYIIFYFLTGASNATPMNMNNLIMQNGYVVILATGMLLCVLTGNVDLGVGSYVALTGAVAAKLVCEMGLGVPAGFLVAVLVGLAFGLFNGCFIAYLHIPPFVVTLASMLMGRGLTYVFLQSKTIGPVPDTFKFFGAGFFWAKKVAFGNGTIELFTIGAAVLATICLLVAELRNRNKKKQYGFALPPLWQTVVKLTMILAMIWFYAYKLARYNGMPIVLLIMGVIVGIYYFITARTVAGRQVFALGGNAKAAKLSGIDTRKVFLLVYANMGLLAGIAGVVLAARAGSATPKAGDGFELDAIAACYIGGAAASGGVGTVLGAVVGAFVMGILNNGMILCGLSTDIQKVVKGLVLLGAVTFDVISTKRRSM